MAHRIRTGRIPCDSSRHPRVNMTTRAHLTLSILLGFSSVVGCGGENSTDANMNDTASGGDTGIVSDTAAMDATATDTPASMDGASGCESATTCGACTPMGECGFCRNNGRCLHGTATGPDNMACTMADWAWLTSQCGGRDGGGADVPPVMCQTTTTCATCTPRIGCGWCRTTNTCIPGTSATMSTDGTCTGANWAYVPSACASDGGGGG